MAMPPMPKSIKSRVKSLATRFALAVLTNSKKPWKRSIDKRSRNRRLPSNSSPISQSRGRNNKRLATSAPLLESQGIVVIEIIVLFQLA